MDDGSSRVIVGITGATGAIYGVRLLETLRDAKFETHLVVSKWAARTLIHEMSYTLDQVQQLAARCYPPEDQGAVISSGSFLTRGMAVCPCSVRSLAAIASGGGNTLVHRAADVVLKEHRTLVLVVRETPLSGVHLQNMLKLSRMGAVILPPVPAFYDHPETIEDIVNQTALRVLDQLGIHLPSPNRWQGNMSMTGKPPAPSAPNQEGRR